MKRVVEISGCRSAVIVAAAALSVLVMALPAPAQSPVRIVGEVQWVSANRLAMMTEAGDSVVVDLMQAEQSSYRALRSGDWVLVDGTLSRDRRHMLARDIWRDNGRGAWTQSP